MFFIGGHEFYVYHPVVLTYNKEGFAYRQTQLMYVYYILSDHVTVLTVQHFNVLIHVISIKKLQFYIATDICLMANLRFQLLPSNIGCLFSSTPSRLTEKRRPKDPPVAL